GSVGMVAQARAWTLAVGGELSTARDLLLAAAGEMNDRYAGRAELLHDVVRLGAPEAVVAGLDELALRCDSPMIEARAAHARGAARRDPVLLEETADRFAAMGASLYAAEAMTTAAGLWQADGDQRRAAGALARAATLAASCEGARTPELATVEGRTVPLTQREREICLLAAEGCTSKQIADRLVLSIRTVNNHLQNAYTKLGVGSRSELATALRTA
ncbi:MAG: helix-turn-helix transcriptional regulator, partial [Streptosporangiaceae bacterium]